MKTPQTASQTVGPFFKYGLDRPAWADLTAHNPTGTRIRIAGQVFDGDHAPIRDAILEIWQANAAGRYAHPDDTQDKALDANFLGFGRAATDEQGNYAFTTIRPGRVPGHGNTLQAPHILMSVFARGLLNRVVTRIYFPDEPSNDTDPVLSGIDDTDVRATLVAKAEAGAIPTYRFDIILQGEGETAFFDI